jgi:hypothetical protein
MENQDTAKQTSYVQMRTTKSQSFPSDVLLTVSTYTNKYIDSLSSQEVGWWKLENESWIESPRFIDSGTMSASAQSCRNAVEMLSEMRSTCLRAVTTVLVLEQTLVTTIKTALHAIPHLISRHIIVHFHSVGTNISELERRLL